MRIHISSTFDSGNIIVRDASTAGNLSLAIRPDVGNKHLQWFHYRVTGCRGEALSMRIGNAKEASYPDGWNNYRACASYDRQEWFRVTTSYRDGVLHIDHTPERDSVYYAYFAPYSLQRHYDMLARCSSHGRCQLQVLGSTIDGRTVDMLHISANGWDMSRTGQTTPAAAREERKHCYFIARQHPGESMASWFMEGLLTRLLNDDDPLVRALLQRAVLHLVPNMNPDGSFRGHLRTNAVGANLNREWHEPSMDKSPEVYLVRQHMDQTGLRFCLDVHGDEALPYNFIAGADGVIDLPEHIRQARHQFVAALMRANPDFQSKYGYPKAALGKANMSMATNQLSHRFQALAMTLEQPFKDNQNAIDERHGWSPARCQQLGASSVDALMAVVDNI